MSQAQENAMEITYKTYDDLTRLTQSFADGHLNLVIIVGDPGLGKSRAIRDTVGAKARIIEGQLSAFQLYKEIWDHLDEPLIIDDVDKLYVDKDSIRLLKLLCQTEDLKTVQWNTANSQLDSKGIPREFSTSSPVCIIANEFKTLNPNTKAIADRGLTVHFEPDIFEVHSRVGTWFDDLEVYDFVGDNLGIIRQLSQRIYCTARDMKDGGLDWRSAMLETWKADFKVIVLKEVFEDENLKTQAARQQRWSEITGRDRATFYRLAKCYPEYATLRHYGHVLASLEPTRQEG